MVSGFDFRRRQNGIGLTLGLYSFALVIFSLLPDSSLPPCPQNQQQPFELHWAPIMQASRIKAVKPMLHSLGHETKDFGAFSEDSVDYPEFVRPAAEAVAKKLCDLGVVFGGSGNGEAMAANKIKGVRA